MAPRRKHRRNDPPTPPCGAATRRADRRPCRRPAGWGTDHVGQGKCRLHGGATPITTGQRSKVLRRRLAELVAQHQAHPEPIELPRELAFLRALLDDFAARADLSPETFHATAAHLVEAIARTAERITRIRSAESLSNADLYRVFSEIGRIVESYVSDPVTRARIVEGWQSIRLSQDGRRG